VQRRQALASAPALQRGIDYENRLIHAMTHDENDADSRLTRKRRAGEPEGRHDTA